jgi:hypothetical protein
VRALKLEIEHRLYRRLKRIHRIPLGRGSVRSLALAGSRTGGPQRGCNFLRQPSSAFAAKAATRTIPIVFGIGADPVKLGLVDSLNRPGGNLTGVSALNSFLGPKRLEIFREMLPDSGAIALLVNPSNPNMQADAVEAQAAADAIGQRGGDQGQRRCRP